MEQEQSYGEMLAAQANRLMQTGWAEMIDSLDANYVNYLMSEMDRLSPTAPSLENVFRPMLEVDPEHVKVVMIGQDPYKGELPNGQPRAIGRSFAIARGEKIPYSLAKIFKLRGRIRTDQELDLWVQQGVLLINASPLLYEGSDKISNPWRLFTETVVRYVCYKSPNAVFVLMGKNAASFANCFTPETRYVETPHPAAMVKPNFSDSQMFDRIDALLDTPITW